MGPDIDEWVRIGISVGHVQIAVPVLSWRLSDPHLLWRQWPDEAEVVAFSPACGTLHLLNAKALPVLQDIAHGVESPLTTGDNRSFALSGTSDDPSTIVVALREADLIEDTATDGETS